MAGDFFSLKSGFKFRKGIILILILLFSLWIRLAGIADFCLFWDEMFGQEWNDGTTLFQAIEKILVYDVHPPLFYLFLRPFLLTDLPLEYALRLPAALIGAAGVLTTFLCGELTGGFYAGFSASLLIAVNPMHFYHSQESRMYTLLYFVSSLLLLFWIRKKKGIDSGYQKIAAVSILGLYSHYYFIFPLLFVSVIELYSALKKRQLKNYMLSMGTAAFLFLPMAFLAEASPLHRNFTTHLTEHAGWLVTAGHTELFENIRKMLEGYCFSLHSFWYSGVFIAVVLFFLFNGVRKKSDSSISWISGYLILPLLTLFYGSWLLKMLYHSAIYEDRHSMFSLPALVLILGIMISRLKTFWRTVTLISLLLVFLQDTLEQVKNADRSYMQAGAYITGCNSNPSVLSSPFPTAKLARQYTVPSAEALTFPDDTKDKIYSRINNIDKDSTYLIWRDIGQLIGEGDELDLYARKLLLEKGLCERSVFYNPHSSDGFLRVYGPGKSSSGSIEINLEFSNRVYLNCTKNGESVFFSDGRKKRYQLELNSDSLIEMHVYKSVSFMPFYQPEQKLPIICSNDKIDRKINLPVYFSSWWILAINLSCFLSVTGLFLSCFQLFTEER